MKTVIQTIIQNLMKNEYQSEIQQINGEEKHLKHYAQFSEATDNKVQAYHADLDRSYFLVINDEVIIQEYAKTDFIKALIEYKNKSY